jgi:hypothetical protein
VVLLISRQVGQCGCKPIRDSKLAANVDGWTSVSYTALIVENTAKKDGGPESTELPAGNFFNEGSQRLVQTSGPSASPFAMPDSGMNGSRGQMRGPAMVSIVSGRR